LTPIGHGLVGIAKEWEIGERAVIEVLLTYLHRCEERYGRIELIGYNIQFDINQILVRAILCRIPTEQLEVLRRAYKKDLMQMLALLNGFRYLRASRLADALGMPFPHGNEDIPRLYREKRYDEIINYILKEARFEETLYEILSSLAIFLPHRLYNLLHDVYNVLPDRLKYLLTQFIDFLK